MEFMRTIGCQIYALFFSFCIIYNNNNTFFSPKPIWLSFSRWDVWPKRKLVKPTDNHTSKKIWLYWIHYYVISIRFVIISMHIIILITRLILIMFNKPMLRKRNLIRRQKRRLPFKYKRMGNNKEYKIYIGIHQRK